MSMPGAGRWGDLGARVASGAALLAVGGGAIWLGGPVFAAMAVLVTGLMIWELQRMLTPQRAGEAVGFGLLAGAVLALVLWLHGTVALGLLLVPPVLAALRAGRDRGVVLVYGLAVMLAGYGLVALRQGQGLAAILWIVAVVVTSDVMGYFAGRMIGGPKFWPRISPKKTWSGTVAGWIGAALVGLIFVLTGAAGWGLVWLSPVLALAGQMGDIAESWIKRRAGVKDSSNLIPGHGGVLDRFDALLAAVVMVLLAAQVMVLPLAEG